MVTNREFCLSIKELLPVMEKILPKIGFEKVLSMYSPIGDSIWIYSVDILLLEALALYTWRFRSLPGAVPFISQQVCKGAWLLFLVLASMSEGLAAKIFWINMQQITAVFSPYLWLLFIWQLSQPGKNLPPVMCYGFLGIIGVVWLFITTNFWHGLYWREIWLDGQTVRCVFGPAGWLALINSYLLCVVSVVLSGRWVLGTAGLRRRQALWFIMPAVFTWAGHMLSHTPACRIFAPQALGFLLNGILVAWAYYRWRVYSILPLAQETVARNMIDGLLVVDDQNYIVSMNPAAEKILSGLPAVIGGKFQQLVAAWPVLAELNDRSGMAATKEAVRKGADGLCYYKLNRIPLQIANLANQHSFGQVFLFTDITRQKQDQEKMMEQQKALSILTERNRLSRELHDMQGQFPGYVKTQAQVVGLLLQQNQPEQAKVQLESLVKAADAAFTDVRSSITALKSPTEDWSFFQNMRHWLNQFQKISGITMAYHGPESVPAQWITPEAEVQLLRIIQEVLTNIKKHSGADYGKVNFQFPPGRLVVTIADNGCGFDAEKKGKDPTKFGLNIIRERAAEIDGSCIVKSTPGKGTMVTIDIPFHTG